MTKSGWLSTKRAALIPVVTFFFFIFSLAQVGWGGQGAEREKLPPDLASGQEVGQLAGEASGAVEKVSPPTAAKKHTLRTVLLIGGFLLLAVTIAAISIISIRGKAKSLVEDFESGQAHGWSNNGHGSWSVVSGVYTFNGSGSVGENACSWYDLKEYTNFTYEARVRNWGDQAIAFRGNPPNQDWYVLYAWGNGQEWAMFRIAGNSWTFLHDYTVSAALKTYPEWNTFKVTAASSAFTFFINGVQVGSVSDAALASGKIGFLVRNYTGVKAEYDDVHVTPQ